jgi:hypothetical protein
MLKKRPPRIVFPREVLLVEIERHCADTNCNARTRIGLTKEEARLYDGFECERCELWQADGLAERDIPDWWEELTITGLDTLRPGNLTGNSPEMNQEGEGVVARLSEAWQRRDKKARDEGRSAQGDAPEYGGDEPV